MHMSMCDRAYLRKHWTMAGLFSSRHYTGVARRLESQRVYMPFIAVWSRSSAVHVCLRWPCELIQGEAKIYSVLPRGLVEFEFYLHVARLEPSVSRD